MLLCCLGAIAGKQKKSDYGSAGFVSHSPTPGGIPQVFSWPFGLILLHPCQGRGTEPVPYPALCFRRVWEQQEGGGSWRWAANLPGCPGKEQLQREDGSSCGYEISHSMKKWI